MRTCTLIGEACMPHNKLRVCLVLLKYIYDSLSVFIFQVFIFQYL